MKDIKKALEEMQIKMSEYAVAEAKAKKEKAEVELETARIQQQHIRKLIEEETLARYGLQIEKKEEEPKS